MRDAKTEGLLRAVNAAAQAAGAGGVKVQAIVWEAADGGIRGRAEANVAVPTETEADRA